MAGPTLDYAEATRDSDYEVCDIVDESGIVPSWALIVGAYFVPALGSADTAEELPRDWLVEVSIDSGLRLLSRVTGRRFNVCVDSLIAVGVDLITGCRLWFLLLHLNRLDCQGVSIGMV